MSITSDQQETEIRRKIANEIIQELVTGLDDLIEVACYMTQLLAFDHKDRAVDLEKQVHMKRSLSERARDFLAS